MLDRYARNPNSIEMLRASMRQSRSKANGSNAFLCWERLRFSMVQRRLPFDGTIVIRYTV